MGSTNEVQNIKNSNAMPPGTKKVLALKKNFFCHIFKIYL